MSVTADNICMYRAINSANGMLFPIGCIPRIIYSLCGDAGDEDELTNFIIVEGQIN